MESGDVTIAPPMSEQNDDNNHYWIPLLIAAVAQVAAERIGDLIEALVRTFM